MHIGYEGKCQSLETKEDTGKKSWGEQKWTFLLPLGMERQQVVSQGEDYLVAHTFILICVSAFALKVVSSVPIFFWFHIYALIYDI